MERKTTFQTLDQAVRYQSAHMLMNHADLVLTLWPDGEIADARLGAGTALPIAPEELLRRPVADIAREADRSRLDALVSSARAGMSTRPVIIQHSDLISEHTEGQYTAHLLAEGKNVVLIGKLRTPALKLAERSVEAEIARCTAGLADRR